MYIYIYIYFTSKSCILNLIVIRLVTNVVDFDSPTNYEDCFKADFV